jgi:hypothetical protein
MQKQRNDVSSFFNLELGSGVPVEDPCLACHLVRLHVSIVSGFLVKIPHDRNLHRSGFALTSSEDAGTEIGRDLRNGKRGNR